jgi:EmrB/QacA subfamily drug resistance transporter
MVVLILGSFMNLMDTTIVNVALPDIQRDLGATAAQVQGVVGAYALSFACILVTGGRLGDIWGRKLIFVLGVGGFTLASLLAALSHDGGGLVALRAVQGVFAGAMVPQVLSTAQALFSPKERTPIYAVVGAVAGLAAVAGPLLGGWLVTSDPFGSGWRSIFLVIVPLGLLLILLALWCVPESKAPDRLGLDVTGVVLITAGIVLVVYPLIQGRQEGWPVWSWVMLGAASLVLAIFVLVEHRKESRSRSILLPPSLFRIPGYAAGLVVILCFQAGMVGFFLVLSFYLQDGLHYTALSTGLTLLSFTIGAFIGSAIAVPLVIKLGKTLLTAGAILSTVAIGWADLIVARQGQARTGSDLVLALGLGGIGLTITVVPLVDVALANIPVSTAGTASGALSTFQQVGGSIGVAIIGVVFFRTTGTRETPASIQAAFIAATWVCVGAYVLAAIISVFLPTRREILALAERRSQFAEES